MSGGLSDEGNRVLSANRLCQACYSPDRVCQAYCCQACPRTAEDTMESARDEKDKTASWSVSMFLLGF